MTVILRILIAFIVIAAVAGLAALLAQTPGTVTLHWLGYRIDTTVGVLIGAVLLVVAVIAILYRVWGTVRRVPRHLQARQSEKRREEGYLAISRGMVALAAGDAKEAKRQAKRANEILKRPAGALLIGAQAAQIEGNSAKARQFFEAMLENEETELLGVRGLLAIAEEQDEPNQALALAERARAISPSTPWAARKLLEHRVAAGQWAEAEDALVEAMNKKIIGAEEGKRTRAVILVQLSVMAARLGETKQALERARRAHKLAPDFVPAALQLGTLELEEGKTRALQRLVERVWKTAPHPDLGRLYRRAVKSKDPMSALRALERLEELAPEDPATQLLLARAALDAKLFGEARRHLKRNLELGETAEPTAAYCRLMSDLEFGESQDAAAAREWLNRATRAAPNKAWVCGECSYASVDWSAKCPSCGAFNSLAWRRPSWVSALDHAPEGEVVDASIAPATAETASRAGGTLPARREETLPEAGE